MSVIVAFGVLSVRLRWNIEIDTLFDISFLENRIVYFKPLIAPRGQRHLLMHSVVIKAVDLELIENRSCSSTKLGCNSTATLP